MDSFNVSIGMLSYNINTIENCFDYQVEIISIMFKLGGCIINNNKINQFFYSLLTVGILSIF